ncbi:ABC transporter ATP-binding protein [Zavarzinia sp. CC-PAN008]|uniref:ABC transporter ATP-binding protein n=1 Tax=Zavarzinia sp. CC-PAN008 TaxID=3243332 RepID=UPI003F747B65
MSDVALALTGIRRSFVSGTARLDVLRGVDLAIQPGEIVALVGPSGSGKSTLLHIAGLLERADAGEIRIAGQAISSASDAERTATRRTALGFVYQFHHLLPEFSAAENVMLPQFIAGRQRGEASARAAELLARVGLDKRGHHRPGKLSGGEQQRVAIARALANRPAVLLADEPTGNLDHGTAEIVFGELMHLVREDRLAALIATHNPDLAARMDRIVTLKDGVLVAA